MPNPLKVFIYQNDHLGTPQKITAGNGEIVWSAKYNSFGEAIIEIEAVENNLRFPGQYEDGETGLYYNYYRYYDSDVGRYLRKDPAGIMRGLNHIYSYSRNNPLVIIDPLGLLCKLIDTTYNTVYSTSEEVVYGDWIYEKYLQTNIFCWCIWHRDKRIDITTTWTTYKSEISRCYEKDDCGREYSFIRIGPGEKHESGEYVESEYGGREMKKEFGTMRGIGAGVESGGSCDCTPMTPPPPGLYSK